MGSSTPGSGLPEKIGHYKIVSELGRGGMGVVYRAHEESLNRAVAIKVLGDHLASDAQFLSRFLREARAAGGLSHPNVIPIYFIGEDNGRHYFAMEYVSGRSVETMIRQEGRIDNPRASQIILQAAHGLSAAHDKEIIHRDIKPANLMVDERGVVKVADFGIALAAEAQARLTATGALMGTPGYLSPEHCMGVAVDHRADIYALGVTYYEMLTGLMPFNAESPLALLRQILQEDPPDVAQLNPEVDEESRRILKKMIARNRDERYQTCHDLIADLEEYLAARNVRSITANLGTRSKAAPLAASTPTMQISSDAPTGTLAPDQPQTIVPPTLVLPGAPTPAAGPPSPAKVTAPERPLAQPATMPGQVAAQPSKGGKSFALVAAILAIAFVVAAAGTGVIGYRVLKSRGVFGGSATQAAAVPVAPAQQQAAPAATGSVELANVQPSPSDVLESQQPLAQTQTQTPTQTRGVDVSSAPPPATKADVATARPRERADETSAPPPRARSSRVAVAVQGEAGLNASVAQVLASELSSAGFDVVNTEDLPATESLSGGASSGSLLNRLQGEAGVLVIAKIEATGQRQLQYWGRSDTAYGSRVTIVAYDVASGRPIGKRASASIEYTQLNADAQAEEAVGPLAKEIAGAIRAR